MVQFKAYAPRVVQYQAEAAISAGHAVSITGMTTVNNPVPNTSLTVPCPQVSKIPASSTSSDFLGVALNDAAADEWVDVVVEGIVEAQFDVSHDINAGNPLIVSDAAGRLADLAASSLGLMENVCCYAAEAGEDDATTAGEKIRVYIPPRHVTVAGDMI